MEVLHCRFGLILDISKTATVCMFEKAWQLAPIVHFSTHPIKKSNMLSAHLAPYGEIFYRMVKTV